MIDYIKDNTIVESFSRHPVVYVMDDTQYRIRDLVNAGYDVEALGFHKRERQGYTLGANQYLDGYSLEVIDGKPVEVPIIAEYTAQELEQRLTDQRLSQKASQRRARLALLQLGLLSDVETAIAGLPEPDKTAALIEWEYAQEIKRSNSLVQNMIVALGWTEEQVDTIFATAQAIPE